MNQLLFNKQPTQVVPFVLIKCFIIVFLMFYQSVIVYSKMHSLDVQFNVVINDNILIGHSRNQYPDQDVEHFCNPRTFLRIPYLSTLFPLHPLKEISIFMPIDHIGLF